MISTVEPVNQAQGMIPLKEWGGEKQSTEEVQTKVKESKKLSAEEMQKLVQELNESMKMINTNLAFSLDEVTNRTILRVINSETKELVRQIPSEEMLRISQQMSKLLGILVDHNG